MNVLSLYERIVQRQTQCQLLCWLSCAVQRSVMTFEQQFHYGIFYAYMKLKEQEIRNIMWISECVAQVCLGVKRGGTAKHARCPQAGVIFSCVGQHVQNMPVVVSMRPHTLSFMGIWLHGRASTVSALPLAGPEGSHS